MFIERKSILYFEDAIRTVTRDRCPDVLITDCAVVCAFLENTAVFDRFYQAIVDPHLELAYEAEKEPYQKRSRRDTR